MRKKGATRSHTAKEPVLSDYTAVPYLKLLRTYSMLDLISWEDAAKLEVLKIELEKERTPKTGPAHIAM
jgi:hypothetical protein